MTDNFLESNIYP
jgi:hypothetical protein